MYTLLPQDGKLIIKNICDNNSSHKLDSNDESHCDDYNDCKTTKEIDFVVDELDKNHISTSGSHTKSNDNDSDVVNEGSLMSQKESNDLL